MNTEYKFGKSKPDAKLYIKAKYEQKEFLKKHGCKWDGEYWYIIKNDLNLSNIKILLQHRLKLSYNKFI